MGHPREPGGDGWAETGGTSQGRARDGGWPALSIPPPLQTGEGSSAGRLSREAAPVLCSEPSSLCSPQAAQSKKPNSSFQGSPTDGSLHVPRASLRPPQVLGTACWWLVSPLLPPALAAESKLGHPERAARPGLRDRADLFPAPAPIKGPRRHARQRADGANWVSARQPPGCPSPAPCPAARDAMSAGGSWGMAPGARCPPLPGFTPHGQGGSGHGWPRGR